MDNKSYQFSLWSDCNNKCEFCYNKHCIDVDKSKAIEYVEEVLTSPNFFKTYNEISLIGGEFFQGQISSDDLTQDWFRLIRHINILLNNNLLNKFQLNVTLTIGDQELLYKTLNKISKIENVWLVTSYDTIGRFHTQKMEDNWKYHMKNIKKLYPNVNLSTTMILTEHMINSVLYNKLDLHDFKNEFQTELYFVPPAVPEYKFKTYNNITKEIYNSEKINFPKTINNEFFVKRETFKKFVYYLKYKHQEELNKLFNIKYRSDILDNTNINLSNHLRMKEQYTELVDNLDVTNECGHSYNYMGYSDSSECMICDIKKWSIEC